MGTIHEHLDTEIYEVEPPTHLVTVYTAATGGDTSNRLGFTVNSTMINGGFEVDANSDKRPDAWTSTARFTQVSGMARSGLYAGQLLHTTDISTTVMQTLPVVS